jgi:WhiB family transcriptional regulator, redox-sensing transcriptional regulator
MAGPQVEHRVRASRAIDPDDWATRARCRGMDAELFFARNLHDARPAIRACNGCDVRNQCLDYAVTQEIEIGVWGGLTERQRRAYTRQRLAG